MYDPTKPYCNMVLEKIRKTQNTRFMTLKSGFVEKKFKHDYEIDHTDGIGTKGIFHWKYRTFKSAVLDALAMNLNDLLMFRATPYKLQNHLFLPKDDIQAIDEIFTALADECESRDIAVTGGEIAIHDEILGMEMSITLSGFTNHISNNAFIPGDILIGLPSSGLHSNGTTLIRELLPFKREWTAPTKIYKVPDMRYSIRGIQHITGGAFTKFKINRANLVINKKHGLFPQQIFKDAYEVLRKTQNNADETVYRFFNCGIGMILSVCPTYINHILGEVEGQIIGKVEDGCGKVIIDSMFSDEKVMFQL